MRRFIYETVVVVEGYVLSTFARLTGRPRQAGRVWAAAMAELDAGVERDRKAGR